MKWQLRSPQTPAEWQAYYQLRWQVLRAPWQQPKGSEQDELEQQSFHAAAWTDQGEVVAVGRVHKLNEQQAQVRYMAVSADWQGHGLGALVLQQLEQQLKQKNSALKPELQLASAQASQQQWQLHQKIDLLSPRPVAETVKVQLGNGQLLQLSFAAGQSAETSLQQIQQVFADAGIEVKAQAQTLVFSSQKQPALLQQAWQVQGEGVRLAAGNPIQLKLQAAKNPLTLLADQARQLDNQQAYQAELAQVQQKLQGLMRQVQAERQILLNKLNALQQADSTQMAEQALQTSAELKLQMQTGAAATVPAILSQGQITRSLVEFALAG